MQLLPMSVLAGISVLSSYVATSGWRQVVGGGLPALSPAASVPANRGSMLSYWCSKDACPPCLVSDTAVYRQWLVAFAVLSVFVLLAARARWPSGCVPKVVSRCDTETQTRAADADPELKATRLQLQEALDKVAALTFEVTSLRSGLASEREKCEDFEAVNRVFKDELAVSRDRLIERNSQFNLQTARFEKTCAEMSTMRKVLTHQSPKPQRVEEPSACAAEQVDQSLPSSWPSRPQLKTSTRTEVATPCRARTEPTLDANSRLSRTFGVDGSCSGAAKIDASRAANGEVIVSPLVKVASHVQAFEIRATLMKARSRPSPSTLRPSVVPELQIKYALSRAANGGANQIASTPRSFSICSPKVFDDDFATPEKKVYEGKAEAATEVFAKAMIDYKNAVSAYQRGENVIYEGEAGD